MLGFTYFERPSSVTKSTFFFQDGLKFVPIGKKLHPDWDGVIQFYKEFNVAVFISLIPRIRTKQVGLLHREAEKKMPDSFYMLR